MMRKERRKTIIKIISILVLVGFVPSNVGADYLAPQAAREHIDFTAQDITEAKGITALDEVRNLLPGIRNSIKEAQILGASPLKIPAFVVTEPENIFDPQSFSSARIYDPQTKKTGFISQVKSNTWDRLDSACTIEGLPGVSKLTLRDVFSRCIFIEDGNYIGYPIALANIDFKLEMLKLQFSRRNAKSPALDQTMDDYAAIYVMRESGLGEKWGILRDQQFSLAANKAGVMTAQLSVNLRYADAGFFEAMQEELASFRSGPVLDQDGWRQPRNTVNKLPYEDKAILLELLETIYIDRVVRGEPEDTRKAMIQHSRLTLIITELIRLEDPILLETIGLSIENAEIFWLEGDEIIFLQKTMKKKRIGIAMVIEGYLQEIGDKGSLNLTNRRDRLRLELIKEFEMILAGHVLIRSTVADYMQYRASGGELQMLPHINHLLRLTTTFSGNNSILRIKSYLEKLRADLIKLQAEENEENYKEAAKLRVQIFHLISQLREEADGLIPISDLAMAKTLVTLSERIDKLVARSTPDWAETLSGEEDTGGYSFRTFRKLTQNKKLMQASTILYILTIIPSALLLSIAGAIQSAAHFALSFAGAEYDDPPKSSPMIIPPGMQLNKRVVFQIPDGIPDEFYLNQVLDEFDGYNWRWSEEETTEIYHSGKSLGDNTAEKINPKSETMRLPITLTPGETLTIPVALDHEVIPDSFSADVTIQSSAFGSCTVVINSIKNSDPEELSYTTKPIETGRLDSQEAESHLVNYPDAWLSPPPHPIKHPPIVRKIIDDAKGKSFQDRRRAGQTIAAYYQYVIAFDNSAQFAAEINISPEKLNQAVEKGKGTCFTNNPLAVFAFRELGIPAALVGGHDNVHEPYDTITVSESHVKCAYMGVYGLVDVADATPKARMDFNKTDRHHMPKKQERLVRQVHQLLRQGIPHGEKEHALGEYMDWMSYREEVDVFHDTRLPELIAICTDALEHTEDGEAFISDMELEGLVPGYSGYFPSVITKIAAHAGKEGRSAVKESAVMDKTIPFLCEVIEKRNLRDSGDASKNTIKSKTLFNLMTNYFKYQSHLFNDLNDSYKYAIEYFIKRLNAATWTDDNSWYKDRTIGYLNDLLDEAPAGLITDEEKTGYFQQITDWYLGHEEEVSSNHLVKLINIGCDIGQQEKVAQLLDRIEVESPHEWFYFLEADRSLLGDKKRRGSFLNIILSSKIPISRETHNRIACSYIENTNEIRPINSLGLLSQVHRTDCDQEYKDKADQKAVQIFNSFKQGKNFFELMESAKMLASNHYLDLFMAEIVAELPPNPEKLNLEELITLYSILEEQLTPYGSYFLKAHANEPRAVNNYLTYMRWVFRYHKAMMGHLDEIVSLAEEAKANALDDISLKLLQDMYETGFTKNEATRGMLAILAQQTLFESPNAPNSEVKFNRLDELSDRAIESSPDILVKIQGLECYIGYLTTRYLDRPDRPGYPQPSDLVNWGSNSLGPLKSDLKEVLHYLKIVSIEMVISEKLIQELELIFARDSWGIVDEEFTRIAQEIFTGFMDEEEKTLEAAAIGLNAIYAPRELVDDFFRKHSLDEISQLSIEARMALLAWALNSADTETGKPAPQVQSFIDRSTAEFASSWKLPEDLSNRSAATAILIAISNGKITGEGIQPLTDRCIDLLRYTSEINWHYFFYECAQLEPIFSTPGIVGEVDDNREMVREKITKHLPWVNGFALPAKIAEETSTDKQDEINITRNAKNLPSLEQLGQRVDAAQTLAELTDILRNLLTPEELTDEANDAADALVTERKIDQQIIDLMRQTSKISDQAADELTSALNAGRLEKAVPDDDRAVLVDIVPGKSPHLREPRPVPELETSSLAPRPAKERMAEVPAIFENLMQ